MAKSPAGKQQPPWLWIGLAGAVVLALVVAVVVSAGGTDDEVPEGIEQVRSVEVSGDALPEFPGNGVDDPGDGLLAPELTGATFGGDPIEITNDGRGKLVLFLAHWCPHCQAEVPRVVEHLADAELPDGVDLVAVSTAVSESQPNYPPSVWLDRERWSFPVLVDDADGSAARAFGLTGFPFLVGLDAEGEVVARVSGEFSMDALDAMAAAVAP